MSFRAFLRDRRVYILTYAGFGLLTVAIVQLDLWLSGARLQFGNILYIMLFGFLGLCLFLTLEYRRQARFFNQFAKLLGHDSLDQLATVASPATLEQHLVADAWQQLYARLRSELAQERHRGQRRVHLLSQWAHHMKTPVAVIDLELQKARKQAFPTENEGLVNSIAEENDRLSHALQMLLNVIRLDDFAADFRIERVDLVALTRQVVNEHRRTFITHRVYPKIEEPDPALPPALLHVETDPKWLRLVIEQLVSNAIKYAARPDREGLVTFRIRHAAGDTVLEVADDGIGIPPEDLGRVFTPFFTGATGRQHARSTGMGLYLANEACLQLGHRLTIHSSLGAGTQARIHFEADRSIFAGLKDSVTAR